MSVCVLVRVCYDGTEKVMLCYEQYSIERIKGGGLWVELPEGHAA